MPIPPRPIPVHHPRHPQRQKASPANNNVNVRPGSNVPRKSLPLQSNMLDWRSEISLLNDLGPRSVPNGQKGYKLSDLGGVNMATRQDKDKEDKIGMKDEIEGEGRRQVDLKELIEDGRGKREKRATTATTLGFDFIPNPTILTLPEFSSEISNILTSPKSLLTISKSSSSKPTILNNSESPVVSFGGTPNTPSLIPQSDSPEPPEEEEEEDWEYIPSHSTHSTQKKGDAKEEEDDDENEDEDGIIILGELELDDEISRLDTPEGDHWIKKASSTCKKGSVRGKGPGDKLSYANILSN